MENGKASFIETPAGKVAVGVFIVVALGAAVYSLRGTFGTSETEKLTTGRVYFDADTGKQFNHTVALGETVPVDAPSGKKTGFPAEACYWTKDGKIKQEPTYVLVKQVTGKMEPTFCPDCGRLVVPQNPSPMPKDKPPPTEAEYKSRRR